MGKWYETVDDVEKLYPGFKQLLEYWKALEFPACPRCGSTNVAAVSAGIVGRSLKLAAYTRKIHLLANHHPADYYCRGCNRYFDSWGQTVDVGGLLVTVNRPEGWVEQIPCFVQVQNPGKKTVHWDPAQLHALDGNGRQYEVNEPEGSAVEATDLQRRCRVQGYVHFILPEDEHVSKVIYGSAGAPRATWQT